MRRIFIALAFSLGLLAGAHADEVTPSFESNFQDMKPNIALGITAMTDNHPEGGSLTDTGPGIMAYVDASYGPFYAAAWWYNVDYANLSDLDSETDVQVGFRPVVGKFQFNFSL